MLHSHLLNIDLYNDTAENLLIEFHNGVLFTPNIDHFVLLQRDKEFYEAYRVAEYAVLDSQVIFLLSKVFGLGLKEKISGSDLFPLFCRYHRDNSAIKIFLLGGLGDTANQAMKYLNNEAGKEQVVGAYSPSKGFEINWQECEEIIGLIRRSRANMIAVALGAPKQEKWIYHNKAKLPQIDMFMGIGAALDFLVGKQIRAPLWMQRAGLEWLYRLSKEPLRLSKRYLFKDMFFFYYFALDLLHLYNNPFEAPQSHF